MDGCNLFLPCDGVPVRQWGPPHLGLSPQRSVHGLPCSWQFKRSHRQYFNFLLPTGGVSGATGTSRT